MKNDAFDDFTDDINEDEAHLLDELGISGISRRTFLGQSSAAGLSLLAWQFIEVAQPLALIGEVETTGSVAPFENLVKVTLRINEVEKSLDVDSRMTLLDALREKLNLTGSKKVATTGNAALAP